jgi:hypothetical protein
VLDLVRRRESQGNLRLAAPSGDSMAERQLATALKAQGVFDLSCGKRTYALRFTRREPE